MKISIALEHIKGLAEGIDPDTGEMFPPDSPYRDPDTVSALQEAIRALEYQEKRKKAQEKLPGGAGKPWTKEEDTALVEGFDNGKTIKELSLTHQRTAGAIKSRLLKHGKLTL